jgi:chemotaxis protein CheD
MNNHTEPAQIYLKPGDFHISAKPALISTLLGSCVSVTMFSPRLRAGAICHGLLPSCKEKKPCECEEFCGDGTRFVDCSILRMLEWFMQMGVEREEIDVKVFGGSDMFSVKESRSKATVGQQNIAMAIHVLEKQMLRISASDVGGIRGRKIIFSTNTGEVLLKHLRISESRDILVIPTVCVNKPD